jgi:hypothetical protein
VVAVLLCDTPGAAGTAVASRAITMACLTWLMPDTSLCRPSETERMAVSSAMPETGNRGTATTSTSARARLDRAVASVKLAKIPDGRKKMPIASAKPGGSM